MTAPDSLLGFSETHQHRDRLWHAWSILTAKLNILSDRAHAAELLGTFLRDAQQGIASDPRGVKKSAPLLCRGASRCELLGASGSEFRLDFQEFPGTGDGNCPGLHRFREFANEINLQETVL